MITNNYKQKGFTLVEIMVSLGIFSIVAVVALGALIKIMDANRKAQTLQSAVTNLSFSLDAISREMREGTDYACGDAAFSPTSVTSSTACPSLPEKIIAFNSSKTAYISGNSGPTCNLVHAYKFVDDPDNAGLFILEKAEQTACNGSLNFERFLSSNVSIQGYDLEVTIPNYGGEAGFPLAFIHIYGYAGSQTKDKTYFNVQTSVSSRFK